MTTSIIILTHNAKKFIKKAISSINESDNKEKYELVVVDNNSEYRTKKTLLKMHKDKLIDKLLFLDDNYLFAKGNNIGAQICDRNSERVLLLNSDIEVKNKHWLDLILTQHTSGITTLGVCDGNPYTRGDGYCFLIDKELFLKFGLDENYQWFWSITKLEAQVLNSGLPVIAIRNHNNILRHFGGASGKSWRGARGMDEDANKIIGWFNKKKITIVDKISV